MNINFPTSPAVFRWKPAAWLRVAGPDAAAFLQGQFSNDLRALTASPGEASYGLWLTVKGKVLADSFVLRAAGAAGGEDAFWVGSYFSPAAAIRARLESFIIADDVAIADETEAWAGLSILDSATLLPPPVGLEDAVRVFRGRREAGGNLEVVYRVAAGVPAWLESALHGREVTAGELRRRRLAAGIPAVPEDLGPTDLPQEAGLEEEAISFTKGCYLGQEVMARLRSMGQVRRRLVRVAGAETEPPAAPAPLFVAGRPAGELRSAAADGRSGWIGLAMVTRALVAPGTELAWSAEGGPAVRVMEAS